MDTAFQNYHQRATWIIVYKHSLPSEEEPSCSTAPDIMPGFQGHPSAQAMRESECGHGLEHRFAGWPAWPFK